MSISFQAKNALVLGQQLKVQTVCSTVDLANGLSDAPGIIAIDNSTLTATVITLSVGEPVERASLCEVRNRATGAILAIAAVPSLATAQKISVTVNGTGASDHVVIFRYVVAE